MDVDGLISPLLRSSPELVIRYVIEPVGLRVVAVGFEIYAVGFLVEKLVRRYKNVYGYRRAKAYRFKHIQHSKRDIQIRYIISLEAFEVG